MNSFLKAYRKNDPSSKSYLEVILLMPGPKAVFFHRISHFLYKAHLYFFARFVSEFSRFLTGIEIHPGAKLGKNLVLDHGMGIVIGETAVIGSNCLIYHGVTLGGVTPDKTGRRHPILKDGVMIGAGAKIIGAITLGENAKVGAGAIVVSDCPADTTMMGQAAKQK